MPIHNNFYLVDQKIDPRFLTGRGPILSTEISVPRKLAEQWSKVEHVLPVPQVGVALIDTGASRTCVDRQAVSALAIPPIGVERVYTPQGNEDQYKYPARISFPGTTLPSVEYGSVFGAQLREQGLIALIGRDLLSHFVFTYNGPGGLITLAY